MERSDVLCTFYYFSVVVIILYKRKYLECFAWMCLGFCTIHLHVYIFCQCPVSI